MTLHNSSVIVLPALAKSLDSSFVIKIHKTLEAVDYKIIGTWYCKNTMKRKLSEALFIKELKPTLNKKEKSVPLKLFN